MTSYYVLVREWNYPTESGRDTCSCTYDEAERNEALARCLAMAEREVDNFERNVRDYALPPKRTENGAIVTTREGLAGFYYAVRLVKVTPLNTGGEI